jgi:hypothetical protein
MSNAIPSPLPSIHQVILAAVQRYPGNFTRSELAKLITGSLSSRFGDHRNLPEFGRLAGHSRKAITFEIDILLQQKYLALDGRQKVIPGNDVS